MLAALLMKTLEQLRVMLTAEHPCSYLPQQDSRTLFVAPDEVIDSQLYQQLSWLGFRRSGEHIYRPHCQHCQACISCRVVCQQFHLSRSNKRTLKRNQDLSVAKIDDPCAAQVYALYEKYINIRHADGDMFPANQEQYESFIVSNLGFSHYYGFYEQEKLIAVAVVDQLQDGWSAIYSFFDPFESQRSLGRYLILWQIQQCQQQKLPYLYLGYWVKNCDKMHYKINYRPIELHINGQWQLLG